MSNTTKPAVAPETDSKPEVAPDTFVQTQYGEMLKVQDASDTTTSVMATKIVRHIQTLFKAAGFNGKKESWTKATKAVRPTIIASVVANGKKGNSAETIVSRWFTLAHPDNENLLKQVEAKELSLRKAYDEMPNKQKSPAKSTKAKLEDYLARSIACAYALKMTREQFDAHVETAWQNQYEESNKGKGNK